MESMKFATKIAEFFAYGQNCEENKLLVVKINSNVPEEEIYEEFAKIYNNYKILNRKTVSDYFLEETEDIVNELCDDFEVTVMDAHWLNFHIKN